MGGSIARDTRPAADRGGSPGRSSANPPGRCQEEPLLLVLELVRVLHPSIVARAGQLYGTGLWDTE